MRLYILNENCTLQGRVVGQIDDWEAGEVDAIADDAARAEALRDCDVGIIEGDCHHVDGSADDLIAEARRDLELEGCANTYRRMCARSILAWLDEDGATDDFSDDSTE